MEISLLTTKFDMYIKTSYGDGWDKSTEQALGKIGDIIKGMVADQ